MAQYAYNPLQPDHFRVLILLPGDDDSILSCSLLKTKLDQHINVGYEALSYVWGDGTKSQRILCDGKDLYITISLWTALHNMRLRHKGRNIWADAICINQQDLQERADQVQIMRQIYDNAARVVIWLGKETESMRTAFPLIKDFTVSVSEYLDEVPDVYSPEVKHWVMKKGSTTFGSNNHNDLQSFFENPWFLRAWVFQEAVCARSAIVQCGGLRIDFETLELFAVIFFVNGLTTILPSSESRSSHHQLYTIRNTRRLYLRGEKHTLFRLLVGSARAGARDPRDQLFSLAGIAHGQPLPYPPNYTQEAVLWYRDFSAHAISKEPGMEVLTQCFLQPERLPNLPSWAHDWTSPRYVPYQGNHPQRIFNVDGDSASIQQLVFDGDTLILRGYIVDHIARLGNEEYPEAIATLDTAQEEPRNKRLAVLIEMIKECVTLAKEVPHYSSDPENLWQTLWRTLLGDAIEQQNLQNSRIGETYEPKILPLKPLVIGSEDDLEMASLQEHTPAQMEVNNAIYRVSFQRRFCITQNGRLGWAPKYAQEGDAIAVIAGIGVPMALRSKSAKYVVVGSCYIHEIMDGELADRDRLQKELLRLV